MMLFSLFLPIVLAHPVPLTDNGKDNPIKYCAQDAIDGLQGLHAEIMLLNYDVGQYNGGSREVFPLINIISEAAEVVSRTEGVTGTVENCTVFDPYESYDVGEALIGVFALSDTTLATIARKKSTFDNAVFNSVNLSWLMRNELSLWKSSTDRLGKAITEKVDSQYTAFVEDETKRVDQSFRDALKVYNPPK
jgi:hypothetical protein